MTTVDFVLLVTFYFIGVVIAYGAVINERLESISENVTPGEYWLMRLNSALSWAAVFLIFSSSQSTGIPFDYVYSVPPERMWKDSDN